MYAQMEISCCGHHTLPMFHEAFMRCETNRVVQSVQHGGTAASVLLCFCTIDRPYSCFVVVRSQLREDAIGAVYREELGCIRPMDRMDAQLRGGFEGVWRYIPTCVFHARGGILAMGGDHRTHRSVRNRGLCPLLRRSCCGEDTSPSCLVDPHRS